MLHKRLAHTELGFLTKCLYHWFHSGYDAHFFGLDQCAKQSNGFDIAQLSCFPAEPFINQQKIGGQFFGQNDGLGFAFIQFRKQLADCVQIGWHCPLNPICYIKLMEANAELGKRFHLFINSIGNNDLSLNFR